MKKQEQRKNWWEADFSELGTIEPNILHQIKTACEHLDNLFGDTEIELCFCIHCNKRVRVSINVEKIEEE